MVKTVEKMQISFFRPLCAKLGDNNNIRVTDLGGHLSVLSMV